MTNVHLYSNLFGPRVASIRTLRSGQYFVTYLQMPTNPHEIQSSKT